MLQNINDKDYRSLPAPCSQQTLKLLDKNKKSIHKRRLGCCQCGKGLKV